MIYCKKIEDYVEQEKNCLICIFYIKNKDSCWYEEWYPGLKDGRNIEEIGHA
jgi:hypothetical protein